jgi:hypothetical protein
VKFYFTKNDKQTVGWSAIPGYSNILGVDAAHAFNQQTRRREVSK